LLIPGKLTLVVGGVGSGKSSLLSAIIGEMATVSGSVHLFRDNVAYVAQKAWLMNATLRENVLFGRDFEQEKYENVVQMAALIPDIEMLFAGDHTQIGEKVHVLDY
jgi:ABC-type transport system involved in cytochrome bd biosynthesis fused ATPase/permease subunit